MRSAPNRTDGDDKRKHRNEKKPNAGAVRNFPKAKTQHERHQQPGQTRGNEFHERDASQLVGRINPETARGHTQCAISDFLKFVQTDDKIEKGRLKSDVSISNSAVPSLRDLNLHDDSRR